MSAKNISSKNTNNQSPPTAWLEAETARRYEIFTKKTTMYQELSQLLVQLAGLKAGMTVLDLGCGTGISTQIALNKMENQGHIYALDISAPMLAVAKKQISSPHITFLQADALNFAHLIPAPVNRIICNSVFWQIRDKVQLMKQLKQVLAPNGQFVFNAPQSYFIFKDIPYSSKIGILFKQLIAEEYGVGVQDLRTLDVFLNNHGFNLLATKEFERTHSAEESYLFMQIPVATAWMEPPLNYQTRLNILDKAHKQADLNKESKQRWMYFVTQKQ